MTVSIGGRQFVSCTSRAVSIRRDCAGTDLENLLREAGRGDAAILIASPGCWSPPGLTTATAARHGFQVVISSEASQAVRNRLINASILPVNLTADGLAKLQDTVESDPGIVLTVDAGRGQVRAGRNILARFETCGGPGPRSGAPAEHNESEPDCRARSETMAGRLLMAQRLLGSATLPGEVRMRLQRRLVAICDAMKAPGADPARSARRLDRLLTELASAGQPGLAPPPGTRRGP